MRGTKDDGGQWEDDKKNNNNNNLIKFNKINECENLFGLLDYSKKYGWILFKSLQDCLEGFMEGYVCLSIISIYIKQYPISIYLNIREGQADKDGQ